MNKLRTFAKHHRHGLLNLAAVIACCAYALTSGGDAATVAPMLAFFGVSFNKIESFVGQLGLAGHNLNTDTIECYLSNAAPSASADDVKADIAEIATGSGYTGPEDTTNTYSEASGTGTLAGTDIVITASGNIAQFRYVILQNTTPSSPLDPLIGWWDYGSALDLVNGESFTIDFGASILTIT